MGLRWTWNVKLSVKHGSWLAHGIAWSSPCFWPSVSQLGAHIQHCTIASACGSQHGYPTGAAKSCVHGSYHGRFPARNPWKADLLWNGKLYPEVCLEFSSDVFPAWKFAPDFFPRLQAYSSGALINIFLGVFIWKDMSNTKIAYSQKGQADS